MDPDQLLSIRNFGPRSLNELREKLAEFGYLPEGEAITFGGDHGYLDSLEAAIGGDDESDTRDVEEAIASLLGDDLTGDLAAGFGARPTGEDEDE
jgi:hypothetical protein